MALQSCITISSSNRRQLWRMIAGHLLWSCAVFGLCRIGQSIEDAATWWYIGFIALQLWAAAQLLLPVLLLHPEQRGRGFYLFWGMTLALGIWLSNQLTLDAGWLPLLTAIKSGLLLLIATLVGAALARYVKRLWEVAPVCLVMSLADLTSWLYGPTSGFSRQIKSYYVAPEGQAPLIDMFLVKLASPGSSGLTPVFGISDWIMVVFFAIVARRYQINDNLIGAPGEALARQGRIGRYLPISMVALLVAVLLAQITGLFIPVLPLMALVICLWYAVRYLLPKKADNTAGHPTHRTIDTSGECKMKLDLDLLDELINHRTDDIEKIVAGTGYLPRTVIGVGTFLLDNEGNIDLLTAKQQVTFEKFLKPLLESSCRK